jgi:4-hydroxymandelate oxidase
MDDILLNLDDYERAASERMTTNAFGYYVGGADDEVSLRENRAAFERIKLSPRMLIDVTTRDTSTTLLGQSVGFPVVVAPMAMMKLAHRDGELAMARAAQTHHIPMALSTLSTARIEDVAEATTAPLWFQIYVYRDREITRRMVQRAEASGYTALVLTVDVAVAGNRERDVRNRFKLPKGIRLENVTEYALENLVDTDDDSAIAAYAVKQLDPGITWKDLDWLANISSLPVLVKGILRPDDARRAIDHGATGVVISNHGGRQLDTTPAAIEVLPRIVDELGYTGEILIDGGVRRGTDVLKALALGAKGVMLGRPALWGLAVDGEAGAAHVLDILKAEFDRALALSGCCSVADITPDLIYR